MFKQLSQISKNLSDEFAKGLADDLNNSQEPATGSDNSLPAEVQAKLVKFDKYEEKYPRLLAAYKNEKAKIEKLAASERILGEYTPVSSLDDSESLQAFFKDINEKQKMQSDEIKRLTALNSELDEKLSALEENTSKLSSEELEKLKNELTSTKERESTLEKELNISREELETLRKDKENSFLQLKVLSEKCSTQLPESDEKEQLLSSYKQDNDDLREKLANASDMVSKKEFEITNLMQEMKTKDIQANSFQNLSSSQGSKTVGRKKGKGKKKKNNTALPHTIVETRLDESANAADSSPKEYNESEVSLQTQIGSIRVEFENTKQELADTYKSLKEKETELEEVRDMLRDVGNELVEAKDELKNIKSSKQGEIDEICGGKDEAIKRSKDLIADLKKKMQHLEQEVSSLKTEKSTIEEQKKALDKNFLKSGEDLSKVRKENSALLEQVKEYINLKKLHSSLSASLVQKEKTIAYLEKQVKEYCESATLNKQATEKIQKDSEQLLIHIEKLKKENEKLRDDVKKNDASFESYVKENGRLSERLSILEEKYETLQSVKSNSNEQVDAIKRQCEELSFKLKEASKIKISLEDEVSEYANIVQEKTREANTMRRLLSESANDKTIEQRELQEKLMYATDEKAKLQGELSLQTTRMKREINDWMQANQELKSEIHTLKLREKQLISDIEATNSLNDSIKRKSVTASDGTPELEKLSRNLKESLSKADKRMRDLQETNENLMRINDDVNKKLDRLTKNYKTLLNQLTALREEKNDSSARSSRSNSVASGGRMGNITGQEPKRSYSFTKESNELDSQSDSTEKTAYIKNVLLGFLEHKEQRNQLLPVITMLLRLDSNDEKRLLMSLK